MAKRIVPDSSTNEEPESKRLKRETFISLDNHADETKESLLILERIAEYNSEMIYFYLEHCGALARNGQYSTVLLVFNQGMKTLSSVFKSDEFYDFFFLLLWDALEEENSFVFATIEETLLLIVQDTEQDTAENQKNHSEELAPLCCLLIPNAYIAVRNAEEYERLKSLVMRLVKVFPALDNIFSLLHHLISPFLLIEDHVLKYHIPGIMKLLVDCEVNVNAVDLEGNTPLHDVALCNGCKNNERACLVTEILLDNKAHIDTPNIHGQTALDIANPAVKTVLQQHYPLSLQCLAASAVVHHNVPYLHHVPTAVRNFIKLHTPGQAR